MSPLARLAAAAGLLCATVPASASDLVPVRVGQNLDDYSGRLETACRSLVIAEADDGEFVITCHLAGETYLTASATRLKRTYWVAYNELTDDLDGFSARVLASLGYEGDGEPCDYFGDACLRWSRGDEELLIATDANPTGHLTAWQVNQAIEREDAQ